MEENWINIEGDLLSIKDLPQQLKDLNLMPIFLRRYFENIFIKDIKADKDEQIAFQQKFMKKEGIRNKDELEIWLKNNLITEKEISRQLYVNLRLEKFKKEKFGNKIEDVFLKRKKSLDRVTYSLLRVKNRSTISELYIRLSEEEETFADLASNYSEGVEQVFQGLIGPMEIGNANPVIVEKLLASSPGQLLPPFELDGWWIIIRLEKLLPASLNEMMRTRLINEMYELSIMNKIKKTLLDLSKDQVNL